MNTISVDSEVRLVPEQFGPYISRKVGPLIEDFGKYAADGIRIVDEVTLSLFRDARENKPKGLRGWSEAAKKPEGVERILRTDTPQEISQSLLIANQQIQLITASQGYEEHISINGIGDIEIHATVFKGESVPSSEMTGRFDKMLLDLLVQSNPTFYTKAELLEKARHTSTENLKAIGFRPIPKILTALYIRDDFSGPDYLEHGVAELKDENGFYFIVGLRDFKKWNGQAAAFNGESQIGEAATTAGGFLQRLNAKSNGHKIQNALLAGKYAEPDDYLFKFFHRLGTNWIQTGDIKSQIYDRPDLKKLRMLADNPEVWPRL